MRTAKRTALLLVGFACLCGCSGPARPRVAGSLLQASLVVRLPVEFLEAQSKGKLTYSEGAEDEPAEGPAGMDVVEDGSFAISDPLQKRVVMFSRQGDFLREQPLGFGADLVRDLNGRLVARRMTDRGWSGSDGQGIPDPRSPVPTVRLIGPNRGFAAVPGAAESAGLEIEWSGTAETLLSVQTLEREGDGTWWVALEVGDPEDLGTLRKIVRKYGGKGELLAEVTGIGTDYYVVPVEEFRVKKGMLYQLEPLAGEVRVNAWDLRGYQ